MKKILTALSLLLAGSAFAGNVQSLRTDADGNLTASVRGEESFVMVSPESEGEWTATISNAVNFISVTWIEGHYFRQGNRVTVWGRVLGDKTSTSTGTFDLTLPIVRKTDFSTRAQAVATLHVEFAGITPGFFSAITPSTDSVRVTFIQAATFTGQKVMFLQGHYTLD